MRLRNKQVLVVEDDDTLALTYRRVLEAAGMVVTHVASLRAALETLDRLSPDAILLDVQLGSRSGLELLRGAARERTANIPVIVASAFVNRAKLEDFSALGVREVLENPVPPALLLQTMRQHVGHDALVRVELPAGQRPEVKAECAAVIMGAAGTGFRLWGAVRLAPNCSVGLRSRACEEVGLGSLAMVRSAPEAGKFLRRGTFQSDVRLPGLTAAQAVSFEKMVKRWHTK